MTNDKKVTDLEEVKEASNEAATLVFDGGNTKRMTFASMVDNLWDQMYIKARAVICVCSWCGAGNAITNPVCCQCGGAIGKEAKGE